MSRQLILITGGSGFVGSHTVDNFLRHGYRVRLAGRNNSTCERMLATHKEFNNSIEAVVVPDITVPGAFDSAVKGIDGIVHMASPFFHNIKDVEKDMLKPAVDGTVGILESIIPNAPKVKRVVITSSIAAIVDFSQGLRPGHVYDESQWNPVTYNYAKEHIESAYAASKKEAEAAAWNHIDHDSRSQYQLATVNPVMVYGPPFPGSVSLSHLGQSAAEIYSLMNGSLEEVPATRMPVYVDVRDVAEAHRLAYETKESQWVSWEPGRFAVCAGNFTKAAVCRLFRDSGLGLEDRVPKMGIEVEKYLQSYTVDSSRAKEVLGLTFRSFEETFLDMAKAFLALEKESSQL